LFGLAIYHSELGPTEIRDHYKRWIAEGGPDLRNLEPATALYTFNPRSGNIVRNLVGNPLAVSQTVPEIDLLIPERYTISDEKFLQPVWQEFHWEWGYWKNVLINIAGFVPFGFFFYAYLSSARHLRHIELFTVIFGAATSLTIEVLQSLLPTRDSGTTDLITNTLGTCLGLMLYRWRPTLMTRVLQRLPFANRAA